MLYLRKCPHEQGISKATLLSYCCSSVDVVSMGSLTQGYATADFSLKIYKGAGVEAVDKVIASSKHVH